MRVSRRFYEQDGVRLQQKRFAESETLPSSYDLGEDLRFVLLSVTEGEDKPLKYPTIFNSADVAIITKSDLAAAVEFDEAAARRNVQAVRPGMEVFKLSAKTGKELASIWSFSNSGACVPVPLLRPIVDTLLSIVALGFLGMRHSAHFTAAVTLPHTRQPDPTSPASLDRLNSGSTYASNDGQRERQVR